MEEKMSPQKWVQTYKKYKAGELELVELPKEESNVEYMRTTPEIPQTQQPVVQQPQEIRMSFPNKRLNGIFAGVWLLVIIQLIILLLTET